MPFVVIISFQRRPLLDIGFFQGSPASCAARNQRFHYLHQVIRAPHSGPAHTSSSSILSPPQNYVGSQIDMPASSVSLSLAIGQYTNIIVSATTFIMTRPLLADFLEVFEKALGPGVDVLWPRWWKNARVVWIQFGAVPSWNMRQLRLKSRNFRVSQNNSKILIKKFIDCA